MASNEDQTGPTLDLGAEREVETGIGEHDNEYDKCNRIVFIRGLHLSGTISFL